MNQEEFQRKQQARRVEVDRAYAAMTIPEIAREDIRREAFFYRSTQVQGTDGHTDHPQSDRNEGMRVLWLWIEKRIKIARAGIEAPTTALSATAEGRDG